MTLMNYFMFMWLGICSYIDVKRKRLPWVLLLAGLLCVVILSIYQIRNGELVIWDSLGGAVIGFLILIFSRLTNGQIGSGDGVVFFITGILLGTIDNFILLTTSLFLTCMISLFLLILKKVSRKTKIPFLPFIWSSYLLEWMCKSLC